MSGEVPNKREQDMIACLVFGGVGKCVGWMGADARRRKRKQMVMMMRETKRKDVMMNLWTEITMMSVEETRWGE